MHLKLLSAVACLLAGSSLSARAQLANDERASAQALVLDSTGRTSLATSNVGATASDLPALSCGGPAAPKDVWYSVLVPASGSLTVSTAGIAGSPFTDTVLEVYASRNGQLVPLGCNDDYSVTDHFSSLTVSGQPGGSTLLLRVYGFGSVSGAFTVQASEPQLLVNDECAGAIALPVDGSCSVITATNAGASASAVSHPSGGIQSVSPILNDVWFSLLVPASGQVAVTTSSVPGSSLQDTGLILYSGTPDKLTQIASNDDQSPTNYFSGAQASGLTPSTMVYARVWSVDLTLTGQFGICAANPSALVAASRMTKLPLQVSPMPARESLSIQLPSLTDQRSAQVSLRNTQGQVVKLRLISLKSTETPTLLNVADLPAGIYNLRLQTGSITGTHKVVIE